MSVDQTQMAQMLASQLGGTQVPATGTPTSTAANAGAQLAQKLMLMQALQQRPQGQPIQAPPANPSLLMQPQVPYG